MTTEEIARGLITSRVAGDKETFHEVLEELRRRSEQDPNTGSDVIAALIVYAEWGIKGLALMRDTTPEEMWQQLCWAYETFEREAS